MTNQATYRKDIQFLRALAVIAVMIFHLDETWLYSGFVGVDVFFVISGFVVTLSLAKKKGGFGFSDIKNFYLKRIRRLFPALYFAIFVGIILTIFLMPHFEHKHIFFTAISSIFASSNFYLIYQASDYFGIGAELNPFTHTWSLAIEEQFYLLYPFIFYYAFVLFKSLRSKVIFSIYAVSLIFFLFSITAEEAVYGYYFPVSRFWELMLGAIAYIFYEKGILNNLARFNLNLPLLVILILTFFIPDSWQYQTLISILVSCHITFLLLITLATASPFLTKIVEKKVFQVTGEMSYSLYLWHFIIFVIFKWTVGLESLSMKAIAILMVFGLSYFSLYKIENPIRRSKMRLQKLAPLVLSVGVGLVIFCLFSFKSFSYLKVDSRTPLAFSNVQTPEHWLDLTTQCHYKYFDGEEIEMMNNCIKMSEKQQNICLIGDSHALQFYFTVQKAVENKNVNVSFIHNNGIPQILNEGKIPSEFEYFLNNSQRGDILLITFYRGKFYRKNQHLLPLDENPLEKDGVESKYENGFKAFYSLGERAKDKGVKIIMVDDVPQMKLPVRVSSCIFQDNLNLPNSCDVERALSKHLRLPMTKLLKEIAAAENVYYWDPHDLICDSDVCTFKNEEFIKMHDNNHITRRQAEELSPQFGSFLNDNDLIQQ